MSLDFIFENLLRALIYLFVSSAYAEIMERSVFSLAPRGYGKTSFRLYEAFQMGSIPIYIFDDPWIPFTDKIDWQRAAILLHEKDIETIPQVLRGIDDNRYRDMLAYGKQTYEKYMTFEGCARTIMEYLNE